MRFEFRVGGVTLAGDGRGDVQVSAAAATSLSPPEALLLARVLLAIGAKDLTASEAQHRDMGASVLARPSTGSQPGQATETVAADDRPMPAWPAESDANVPVGAEAAQPKTVAPSRDLAGAQADALAAPEWPKITVRWPAAPESLPKPERRVVLPARKPADPRRAKPATSEVKRFVRGVASPEPVVEAKRQLRPQSASHAAAMAATVPSAGARQAFPASATGAAELVRAYAARMAEAAAAEEKARQQAERRRIAEQQAAEAAKAAEQKRLADLAAEKAKAEAERAARAAKPAAKPAPEPRPKKTEAKPAEPKATARAAAASPSGEPAKAAKPVASTQPAARPGAGALPGHRIVASVFGAQPAKKRDRIIDKYDDWMRQNPGTRTREELINYGISQGWLPDEDASRVFNVAMHRARDLFQVWRDGSVEYYLRREEASKPSSAPIKNFRRSAAEAAARREANPQQ